MSAKDKHDAQENLGPNTLLMALEPRLMFDGAALVAGLEVDADIQDDQSVVEQPEVDNGPDLNELLSAFSPPAVETREIVFIDASVPDAETLLADIPDNAEVIEIDGDGLSAITDALANRTGVDAIHIISHGQPGELQFAGDTVNSDNLGNFSSDLSAWGSALADGADILIYGCEVASGAEGEAFVSELSDMTGADVAASDDLTGSEEMGGDVDLEHTSGQVTTHSVLSAAAVKNYGYVLAAPVASDDTGFTSEDIPVDINVLANDVDVDPDDTLTVITWDTTTSDGGTVTNPGNGILTYTPPADYNEDLDTTDGVDTFTYTIFDGSAGGFDTATVSITVREVPDAPAVTVHAETGNENNDIDVLIADLPFDNATDGGSVPAVTSASVSTQPATGEGTVVYDDVNDKFVYSPPNATFNGSTSFTYEVTFANFTTTSGTVNITVNPVNDQPVLDNTGDPTMAAITEDPSTNNGDLVSDLIVDSGSDLITDADPEAVTGIAVTGVSDDAINAGVWQYSTDGGTSWTGFDARVEAEVGPGNDPSDTNAVVLGTDANTRIRFLPIADFHDNIGTGADLPNFNFKAWDQSDGSSVGDVVDTSGDDSFSEDSELVSIVVTPDNDVPELTVGADQSTDEDVNLNLTVMSLVDVDAAESIGDQMTVTISVDNGKIDVQTTTGLTFDPASPDNSATVQFTGTTANVHTALNTLNNIVYDPDDNWVGTDTVEITVSDSGVTSDATAETDTASIDITVSAVNDAPTISKPVAGQNVDEEATLTFSTGDGNAIALADVDAGDNTVEVTVGVTQGDLTLSGGTGLTIPSGGNGTSSMTLRGSITNINAALEGMTYVGDTDATGADTLTITIDDLNSSGSGGAQTNSDTVSTVSITVAAVNDPPDLTDNVTSITEGQAVAGENITVIDGDDSDAEGDTMELTGTPTSTAGNTVAIVDEAQDIKLSYQAPADYIGTDTVTYYVTDGQGDTSTATLTVTVTPDLTDVLIPVDDTASMTEDGTTISIDVLANDKRLDGDGATITITTGGGTASTQGGVLAIQNNGSSSATIDYTPASNFNGTDTFQYTMVDGGGGRTSTVTGTVTITVSADNDAPVATVPGGQTVDENAELTITGVSVADADASTDNIQVTLTATDGKLELPTGTGALMLNAGANNGLSSTMTYTGTVANLNTALADIRYTGNENKTGSDTLSIVVDDLGNNGGSAETDIENISITRNAVDDPPAGASDITVNIIEDAAAFEIELLDGYVETVDGEAVKALFTQPAEGGSVAYKDGSTDTVIFTPAADYFGTATFDFTVADDDDDTPSLTTNTVTINVTNVNDAPDAADHATSTTEGKAITIDVSADHSDADIDVDPDSDMNFISFFNTTTNGGGTVQLNGLTSFLYTPGTNGPGTDTFDYTLTDLLGNNSVATVTVTIGVNTPPVAGADVGNTSEETTLEDINVLGNDIDPDAAPGDELSISDYMQTSEWGGTVVLEDDNTFTYTPAVDYQGVDSFTYTVRDANGATNDGSVSIAVSQVNDLPFAEDDSVTTVEDADYVNIAVLANDYDVRDNDTFLSVINFDDSSLTKGSILLANNEFQYTPYDNEYGEDTFSYTLKDSLGGTDQATVTVTILRDNDDPISNDDIFGDGNLINGDAGGGDIINEDVAVVELDVLANDVDVDDDLNMMFIPSFTNVSKGELVYQMDKTFDYYPEANATGTDSFTYTLMDGMGGVSTSTVTIMITAQADAPSVTEVNKVGTEGDAETTFSVADFSSQITDVDSAEMVTLDRIRVDTLPNVLHGTLELSGVDIIAGQELSLVDITNTTFIPVDSDWNGTTDFTWSGHDGTEWSSAPADVSISYEPVNDEPVLTSPASLTVNEEATLSVTGLDVDDVDEGNVRIQLNVLHGTINIGNTTGLTFDVDNGNNSSSVIFEGDILDVKTALTTPNSVTYVGDDNFYTTPELNERISISVDDLSNGGGAAEQDSAIINLTVNNVIDLPGASPDPLEVAEGNVLAFNQSELLANDTLIESDGVLDIDSFTDPGNGTLTLVNGIFTYTPNADFAGTDTFTYTLTDGFSTDDTIVTITVTAVNSAPLINGAPTNDQEVYADEELVVSGISILDVDVGNSDMQVSIAAGAGNIFLNQTMGLASVDGDNGTGSMIYEGTLTAINNALSSLTYDPTGDSGTDTITITVNDKGGTGTGGEQTAVEVVNITIREINQLPVTTDDVFEINTIAGSQDEGGNMADVGEFILTDNVTLNDTDANTVNLFIAGFTQPDASRSSGSSVSFMGNGVFKYTMGAGFDTYDFFTYTVNDGEGGFVDSIIYITEDVDFDPDLLSQLDGEAEGEGIEEGGGVMMAEAEINLAPAADTPAAEQVAEEAPAEVAEVLYQAPEEAMKLAMSQTEAPFAQLFAGALNEQMAEAGDTFEAGRDELLTAFGETFGELKVG